MRGYLCILLHAHLPFVRHPEHPKFLEESWLFEAITETYIPLLRLLEGWERDSIRPQLTLTLSPTLCTMLQDPLLQERYWEHLNNLIALAEKELHRTYWEKAFHNLAVFYHERLQDTKLAYQTADRDLLKLFRRFSVAGHIEIITTAATHAVLPLLQEQPTAVRAQLLVARDFHQHCFGSPPSGIWLPECAYNEGLEFSLREAGLRWFALETHGVLNARPRPLYAAYAPILTPSGVAAFGRDPESAQQVWSRHQGYPGDFDYRDFYRDIGFDLDWDYLEPHLASGSQRSFTGLKYYRITGLTGRKKPYDRSRAVARARAHAEHFLRTRAEQMQRLAGIMDRPPVLLAPYDAELFGHWWYEGPEFLDAVVRGATAHEDDLALCTPGEYLASNPSQQVAIPSASSWGEAGYWRVWLNQANEWIHRGLHQAQARMNTLTNRTTPFTSLEERALKQAARELLLAQASDWPFILRTGTSPEYAKRRVCDHLAQFHTLCNLIESRQVGEEPLGALERRNNIFPNLELGYWKDGPAGTMGGAQGNP